VIVTASGDGEALARLLTAFVPAAADGLVRGVAVVGASGVAREVAEDAGADPYDAFGEAFEQARGPWVAGLPLAAVLARDWMAIVAEHLRREPAQPARLTHRSFKFGAPAGWLAPKGLARSRLGASAVVVEQDLQRLARRGRALRILDRSRR
jgi:hypothetical protein